MERVECRCRKCGFQLGELLNLWTQIGKSYYSPVLDAPVPLAVSTHGAVRTGEAHTLVGECDLQDIACAACHAIVGLRCIQTPPNHVLAEGQVLLRSISVAFGDPRSGEEADLTVKRWLHLKGLPRTTPGPRSSPLSTSHDAAPEHQPFFPGSSGTVPDGAGAVHISQIRADLETHREDIDRLDSTGYQVVTAFNDAVARVEGHVTSLEGVLQDVQRGLSGNKDDLASLRVDLQHVRRTAENSGTGSDLNTHVAFIAKSVAAAKGDVDAISVRLRKDVADLKTEFLRARRETTDFKVGTAATIQDHARELRALRNEVSALRQLLDQTRAKQPRTADACFPARELDILTSSIAKISNRASQVETLHMELEILKGRVGRLEASRSDVFTHEVSHANASAAEIQTRPTTSTSGVTPTQLCSVESTEVLPEQTRLRPKRSAHPPMQRAAESCLGSHEVTATGPTDSAGLPAVVVESGPKRVRLTKAGVTDRRYQMRMPQKSLTDIFTTT